MEYLFKACVVLGAIFFVIECTRLEAISRSRDRELKEWGDTVNRQLGTKKMSGGSWDYLYWKGPDELVSSTESLQKMADRLTELDYAHDAASETQELVLIIKQFRNRAGAMRRRLSNVWQAVEWLDSGDWEEGAVKDRLTHYREN